MNIIKPTAVTLGSLAIVGATSFSMDSGKVSADTVPSSSKIANTIVAQSFVQVMNDTGGHSYGKWVYQYTAGPYALFKNSVTGNWKYTQIISTTNYTVSVIFDGVARTFHI